MILTILDKLTISKCAIFKRGFYVNEDGKAAIIAGVGNDRTVRWVGLYARYSESLLFALSVEFHPQL